MLQNNGIQYVALVQKFKKSVNDLKVADKDQIAKVRSNSLCCPRINECRLTLLVSQVVQSLTELNIQASSTKDYVTGLSAGSPDVVSIADQAMKCAGDLTGSVLFSIV